MNAVYGPYNRDKGCRWWFELKVFISTLCTLQIEHPQSTFDFTFIWSDCVIVMFVVVFGNSRG